MEKSEKTATVASITTAMDKAFKLLQNLKPDAASVQVAFANNKVDIAYFRDMLTDKEALPTNLTEVLCCYPERISPDQKDRILSNLSHSRTPLLN